MKELIVRGKVCNLFIAHNPKDSGTKYEIWIQVQNYNNNNIVFFSQSSWGRLEMKPERNKFKIQAH